MPRKSVLVLLIAITAAVGVASTATAREVHLKPRLGGALGLVPRYGDDDLAASPITPVVYHGGAVMKGPNGVRLHAIYWAPPGYSYHAGYKQLMDQFLADIAADSGTQTNVFSVQPQFADGAGPGTYAFSFADAINDAQPYPTTDRCASANGVPTCLTDHQVQREVDRVVEANNLPRGLADQYIVLLPQDVDTCLFPGACGTNAFGGYHSVSDLGHGTTIYANIPEPGIEGTLPPNDTFPQGNSDAEIAIDVVAHEVNEAATDPTGVGWMDPNGFEVADKCEFGPLHGPALGQAPDGADYNQLINGHQYLIQEFWSNNDGGCVQRTSKTQSPLPLPQLSFFQFSSTVSGNVGSATALPVKVTLVRAGAPVDQAATTSSATGAWSITLPDHAFGDDRDEIDVSYGPGANSPPDETILTGNGGDPFNEAGWTGWGTLDTGFFLAPDGVLTIGPCFQTGVFRVAVNGANRPVGVCDTESDTSDTPTGATSAQTVTIRTNDNRAFGPGSPDGALVDLGIAAGEPGGGFPLCNADLELASVDCTGLVPGRRYTVRRLHRARVVSTARLTADFSGSGTATFGTPPVGGDHLNLVNPAGRVLTRLHVAHLRVDLAENTQTIAGGRCEAGDYYGPFSPAPSKSDSAGGPNGPAGTGITCPDNGDATGLPTDHIEQTDERSAGQTQVEVPDLEDTTPQEGETLYGDFRAIAEAGLPDGNGGFQAVRDRVSVSIQHGKRVVKRIRNTNTSNGTLIRGLAPGTYVATWKIIDRHGDTRTVRTRFVVIGSTAPPRQVSTPGISCHTTRARVRCAVAYPAGSGAHGVVGLTLQRGKTVVALGHARLHARRATVVLRPRNGFRTGRVTAVTSAPGAGTAHRSVRVS